MTRTMTVQDSVVVAVDPMTVYAQLADPSQMPRWSLENRGADVTAPGRPLTVDEEFVGHNTRGRASWVTRCRVTAADPGARFGFRVVAIGRRTPRRSARIASWDYLLEAVQGGTRVTERWTDDRRWPDPVAAVFDRIVTGGSLFADFQRRNIARTLARLKADLEQV